MFKLYEELFLLSINDARGQVAGAAAPYLPYGLAGALLAELALLGKVQADGKRLAVLDETPISDELLDGALARVAASAKPRKPAHWINALGSGKLPKRVARGLADQNVLRIEERRILWVIPYEAYPQQDASAKYWVKARLRGMVLGGEQSDPRGIALLSLLRGCRLLDLVFTRDERKAAQRKIDALVSADLFGQAVAETLDEVDGALAATMVAVNAVAYS